MLTAHEEYFDTLKEGENTLSEAEFNQPVSERGKNGTLCKSL